MQQHEAILPLQLKELRLSEIKYYWEQAQESATHESWSYSQYLSHLCELEIQKRHISRLARRIKESALPKDKTLSSFDFAANPTIKPAQISALAENDSWIKKGCNLIIFGASGLGKTHVKHVVIFHH